MVLTNIPRIVITTLMVGSVACASSLRAQQQSEASAGGHSIGVPRYTPVPPSRFRIVFGYGGNAGLGLLTPSTVLGSASYQTGLTAITAGFISSRSVTSDVPYRTYSEFDFMYGIVFESIVPHYEDPSDNFHASLSSGISIGSYSERWRPYGRRIPFYAYPPTTFLYSLGLPIQVQAIYEPLRILGIGLGVGAQLFYNISNFVPSYGGAIVVEARY